MIGALLTGLTRFLVGAQAMWIGCRPDRRQRLYFANHASHLDTITIWAALPPELRRRVRPVAAADYWGRGALQRRIALGVLNAVLVERSAKRGNPLAPLEQALDQGASLIIFPEGTRRDEALPDQFKPGLYLLAKRFPDVELVPVYLDNLNRAMPKGSLIPIPLSCTGRFGAPIALQEGEDKADFLARARDAVIALAGDKR